MKPRTYLTVSELYALERAARSARAREIARLIRAGVDLAARDVNALVRVLLRAFIRFAGHAVSMPNNRKEISHA